jgi:hypothetical protein
MSKFLLLFYLFLHLISLIRTNKAPPVICRDPDLGGTRQNNERKFLVLGAENSGGAGIGNLLIFYPAAFYFAATTGRDIIITDNSVLGGVCNIINCGFPFVSQLELAYPDIVNSRTLNQAPSLKFGDFLKYFEGSYPSDPPVIKVGGYMSKSDWWVWFNGTVHCVAKLTACDLGDVMCAERHAYQRLIRGPFKSKFTAQEEVRIRGIPHNIKHALLTLPHAYAPRLDIAVHLRVQFAHFEKQVDIQNQDYKREVAEWINSTECQHVFQAMKERVIEHIKELSDRRKSSQQQQQQQQPIFIYLAADNEEVKDAFEHVLNATLLQHYPNNINHEPTMTQRLLIMKVETTSIAHVKDYQKFNELTNQEGLLDLVFDWYALSLANVVFAWRKGSTTLLSTFVHSAQKVSGTIERTDNNNGQGIGTRGYQLIKDKHGRMKFDLFWGYSFLEDFQIK